MPPSLTLTPREVAALAGVPRRAVEKAIDRRSWSSRSRWMTGFDAFGNRLRKNSGIAS